MLLEAVNIFAALLDIYRLNISFSFFQCFARHDSAFNIQTAHLVNLCSKYYIYTHSINLISKHLLVSIKQITMIQFVNFVCVALCTELYILSLYVSLNILHSLSVLLGCP